MNIRVVSVILLVGFTGFTVFTMSIAQQSLLSFGYELVSSPDTAQVVMDLYIMAVLALVLMYDDIKARGKTLKHWLPYAALTLVFVSMGPLLYLALKPKQNLVNAAPADR